MESLKRKPIVILAALMLLSSPVLLVAAPAAARAAARAWGSASCDGTSYSWTGKAFSDSWTAPMNWSPQGVPGTCAQDSASIGPTPDAAPPNLIVPDSTTLQNLSLSTPGGQGFITLTGGSLTVTDFNWSGSGTISTPITASGAVNISDNYPKLITTPNDTKINFSLAGTTTVSGTGLELNGANIINTGTFNLLPGALISDQVCCDSPDKFDNQGTVAVPQQLPGGGKATISAVAFNDEASGMVTIGSGTTLELQIAPSTFASGVNFGGGGTFLIDNNANVKLAGTVNLAGNTTFQLGLDQNNSAGLLTGKGTLSGDGSFSWTGGTLAADLTVASPVKTSITGATRKVLDASFGPDTGLLNLGGPTTLSGTGLILNGMAKLINTGTFTPQAGSAISATGCCVAPGQFINDGKLVIEVGAGQAFTVPQPGNPGVAFVNSGTVDLKSGAFRFSDPGYIQTAGQTQLDGGSLASTSPTSAFVTLQGGKLTGNGTVTADVVNKALIDPGTSPDSDGIITIKGNYIQTATGTLTTDIQGSATAGTDYDQLAVTGNARLDGALTYNLVNSYLPKGTDFFTVITYATHTGRFAMLKPAVTTPRYWVNYKPTSAVFSYGPWGVDSSGSITSSFYSSVQQNLGTPDFWGRYIGDSKTSFPKHDTCTKSAIGTTYSKDIVASEVTTAHSYGLPILPVYFNYYPTAVEGPTCGQNYAKAAIEFAQHWAGPALPSGTAIFVDIEGSFVVGGKTIPVTTDAGFIKGWHDTFNTTFSYTSPYDGQTYLYNAGYYKAGYYADTNATQSNFDTEYCAAVSQEPQIGTNSFIWTNRPGLSPTNKATEPSYQPLSPPSCASETLAWQYNAGTEMDNVDTDEAVTNLQTLPLWRP